MPRSSSPAATAPSKKLRASFLNGDWKAPLAVPAVPAAPTGFFVKIPPTLRARFKKHCKSRNVTMAKRIAELVRLAMQKESK